MVGHGSVKMLTLIQKNKYEKEYVILLITGEIFLKEISLLKDKILYLSSIHPLCKALAEETQPLGDDGTTKNITALLSPVNTNAQKIIGL